MSAAAAHHSHLVVRVGAGEDLLTTKAFLALSLPGAQYRHTTVRTGLRPEWDEVFEFCATLPCRLILTVHHPSDSTRVPGELCGQGMLLLRSLEDLLHDAPKTFWVPFTLTGRSAGKVSLEVTAMADAPCPNAKESPESHAPGSGRHTFSTPRPPEVSGHGADDEQVRLLELHLEELLQMEQDIKRTYDEEQAALLEELKELRDRVDEAWANPSELQARMSARNKHRHVADTYELSRERSHLSSSSRRHFSPINELVTPRSITTQPTPRSASAPHHRLERMDSQDSQRGTTPRSSRHGSTSRPSQAEAAQAKGPVTGRSASAPRQRGEKSASVTRRDPHPDSGSVLSEASGWSSRSSHGHRARGQGSSWDPEALVPQFVWHINDSGTPRRVRPEGTREMLYTSPHNERCDWGSPPSARYY